AGRSPAGRFRGPLDGAPGAGPHTWAPGAPRGPPKPRACSTPWMPQRSRSAPSGNATSSLYIIRKTRGKRRPTHSPPTAHRALTGPTATDSVDDDPGTLLGVGVFT